MVSRRPILATALGWLYFAVGVLVTVGAAGLAFQSWSWEFVTLLVAALYGLIVVFCVSTGVGLLKVESLRSPVFIGALIPPVVIAGIATVAIVLFQGVAIRARLAADQGTIESMRSAVAKYYREHGQFPERPEALVTPDPPVFQCAGFRYAYDRASGGLRIVSTNTLADCR